MNANDTRARETVDAQWDRKVHKVDWLGLETLIRYWLKVADTDTSRAMEVVREIDNVVAAYTRRGNEVQA